MEAPQENIDTHALPSGFIGMAKPATQRVSVESIARFISHQPEVGHHVTIKIQPGVLDVGTVGGFLPFCLHYEGESGWVARDLLLLFAPTSDERLFHQHDIGRQFRVQKALFRLGEVPVQEPLWLDADGSMLGAPGFVMVAAKGLAPRFSAFVLGPLAVMTNKDLNLALGDVHRAQLAIHNTDVTSEGLEDFEMNAPGNTPLLRSIDWYWLSWEWVDLPEFARLVPVYRWLKANAPDGAPELTHGAAVLNNYLFRGNRLAAVLGWELSCLSQAEVDLALQCLSNQLFNVASGPFLAPTTQQWLEMYEREGGRRVRNFAYYTRLAAYIMLVTFLSIRRYLPQEIRHAQEPLIEKIRKVAVT